MYDFLAGFSSPESILANQNDLFSVFATDSSVLNHSTFKFQDFSERAPGS